MVRQSDTDRAPAIHSKSRQCATEGCTTRLSQYNPGTVCYKCDNPREDRLMKAIKPSEKPQ